MFLAQLSLNPKINQRNNVISLLFFCIHRAHRTHALYLLSEKVGGFSTRTVMTRRWRGVLMPKRTPISSPNLSLQFAHPMEESWICLQGQAAALWQLSWLDAIGLAAKTKHDWQTSQKTGFICSSLASRRRILLTSAWTTSTMLSFWSSIPITSSGSLLLHSRPMYAILDWWATLPSPAPVLVECPSNNTSKRRSGRLKKKHPLLGALPTRKWVCSRMNTGRYNRVQ